MPLVLLCWLANVGSAAATYFLARRHGRAFFAAGWGRRILPPSALGALEDGYARWGIAGIFASRFLPGLRAAVTPFAGVAGVPPLRALVPAAAASLLWYAFLAVVGYTLAANWESAKAIVADANRALGVAAVLATLVVAAWLWRRSRRRAA